MTDNDMSDRSPLSQLAQRNYGRHTTTIEASIPVGDTPTRIIKENPNRVGLMLHNASTQDVWLSSTPMVGLTYGILLSGNGGTLMLDSLEDGESVGYEMWGIVTNGTIEIWVREVIVL